MENGETLVNCLVYIDLNPLRAGLVKRPEDYRWNSLGYHFQTHNKDDFLLTDFGMREFGVKDKTERLRRYRRYVYEAGAIDHPEKGQSNAPHLCRFPFNAFHPDMVLRVHEWIILLQVSPKFHECSGHRFYSDFLL